VEEQWLTERKSRIGIRLPRGDALLVKKVCKARGEDVSDFVRRAVRTELARLSFLKPFEKKVLGVKPRKTASNGGDDI
jgi:hypothetical protein